MIIILLFRDKLYLPPDTNSFRRYHSCFLGTKFQSDSGLSPSPQETKHQERKYCTIQSWTLHVFASPSLVDMIHVNQDHPKGSRRYTAQTELKTMPASLPVGKGNNDRQPDAQCFLLKTLDQPLNRYWSVCLPQCVYWLTLLDEGDETFLLLGMEAAEADDMVEDTEFDESFLFMTPRMAQPSVDVADRGVCWQGSVMLRSGNWVGCKNMLKGLGTHALGCGRRRRR